MKKYLFVVLILFASNTLSAQSVLDSVGLRKNVLKISPLSLLVGDVSVFYERVLTKRASVVGGFGFGSERFDYQNNKANVPSPGRFHYERVTLEYRNYFSRRHAAPVGFYAGVYGRFARLTLDDYQFDNQGEFIRDQNGSLVKAVRQLYVWIPGGMVGWQATPKRMVIDLFFGLQYQLPTSRTPLRSITPELMSREALGPRYGFTVGYRF
ncbi:hypothetical protein [Spirosoma fluminis]